MKKAKIALTAIAVLAVIGGALAFKARQAFIYYQEDPSNHQCTVPTYLFLTTTQFNDPNAFVTILSTAPTTLGCPLLVVK